MSDFFVGIFGKTEPMNETEKALNDLEKSWADFLLGTRISRVGRLTRRQPYGGVTLQARSISKVHDFFEQHREEFEAGDKSAAWRALILCAEENFPMPYWLAAAVMQINSSLYSDEGNLNNLHSAFGMDRDFPIKGARAISRRRDKQLRQQLYAAVQDAMSKRGSTELDPALIDALGELEGFPYEKTKAHALYKEQERIQNRYLKIWKK